MRALITGMSGFVGRHLAERLHREPGLEVIGASRADCDLRDASAVRAIVADARPDYVFHLAAQTSVAASFEAPGETITNNVLCTLNVLEAVRGLGLDATILLAGSSEVYGRVLPDELPIRESNPLRPLTPYAVSKVATEALGAQYFHGHGMRVICTRTFNHSGPGRADRFMETSFAKQIAEIEAGLAPPVLRVGNLEARRDFTDVRDIARAYWLAVTRGEPGAVYNVGYGRSWAIQEVLDTLLDMARVKVTVEVDPARLRPADVKTVEVDAILFRERTGWAPEIPFEQSLRDVLDDLRARVSRGTMEASGTSK